MRPTFQDFCNSRIPLVLGECAGDYTALASYANEAQQRLIMAMSETPAWGSWEKLVIKMIRCDPYITLPSRYARIVTAAICKMPIQIHNEWYETLWAGVGLQDDVCQANNCTQGCGPCGAYDRANIPTAYDLVPVSQLLRVYITDSRDVGKRILFSQARDQNGVGIYSTDQFQQVDGFYLTFEQPFTTSDSVVTFFQGVVKDRTFGDVLLKQVDENTGDEVLLARYGPNETNPAYRRYYIQGLPTQCCAPCCDSSHTAQVECMAKLDFVPVVNPSDPLIIGSLPALKEECAAIRYGESDTPAAQQMALAKHQNAIRLLRQELRHYNGSDLAVNVAPWGNAKLERKQIGTMV